VAAGSPRKPRLKSGRGRLLKAGALLYPADNQSVIRKSGSPVFRKDHAKTR
jgi:hypothetical protein